MSIQADNSQWFEARREIDMDDKQDAKPEVDEVMMFVDGCDYQGHEFGASYSDSVCLDGWLFDADSGYAIEGGWAYTSGGDIPCPKMQPQGEEAET